MMHGYLAYPSQAYHHAGASNAVHAGAPSYIPHANTGSMIATTTASLPPTPQSPFAKENGFYKRYSDIKAMGKPTDSVPEPKKARYDSNTSGTRVVSLRNIPAEFTDLQIVLVGLEFGDLTNILHIKGKGQALIEFKTPNEANDMVQYFRGIPEGSLLKNVESAHSSYQHLTIDNARAATTANTIMLGKQLKDAARNGGECCVIKAIITTVAYPVSIDALYQIFSKYGNVIKILILQKAELTALIQMKDEYQVQQSIVNLNGRNMYNTYTGGCNILNLQPSQHKVLDVKYNNSKSWDYTNPLLLMLETPPPKNSIMADHPLLPIPMTIPAIQTSGCAPIPGMQTPTAAAIQATNQIPTIATVNTAQLQFNPAGNVAATTATGYPIQAFDTRSCVVQVSNFPEQIANPDALFTLFGVYGDILKVKIMYNRRDNALMQFKTHEQALTAVQKLDKVKLWDKVMQVGLSKFPEIQIPLKNDGGLAKDFANSPLHRFKKPGSKNFYNIFQPNQTLHLSNIATSTTQENIQELFGKYGKVGNIKWITKEGNKMALLEMGSIEEAVLALIGLHNHQLNGSYLRVNFAK